MSYAPIALFVYRRLDHLKQVIAALKKSYLSEVTELFIYSDGAKDAEDAVDVDKVRQYIQGIDGFLNTIIIERHSNYGLSRSLIDGVDSIVKKYGKIIVLEDDIVVSKNFLKFMNSALDIYQESDDVISIHGYVYPVNGFLPQTFFLKGADCWGWATWERGWQYFNQDGKYLLGEITKKKLVRAFDYDGTYPYTKMLRNQTMGKNNSWAIRWYASAFLVNKLTLYPGVSLVKNIGNDNSGIHSKMSNIYDVDLSDSDIDIREIEIVESEPARELFKGYFKSASRRRLKHKFLYLFGFNR